MRRKPKPSAPDLRQPWQIAQGVICGCRGTDDMCPCQNENPWPRPVVDWQARAVTAEVALKKISLSVGQWSSSQMANYAREILKTQNPALTVPHP